MQTIIAPTDFSDISLNAVNYAADMALALNTKLLILHATELSMNAGREYTEPTENEVETENRLNALKTEIIKRTQNKIPVSSNQVIGLIENEVIKMCDYQNPLAVVMATKGTSIKEQFFIGSITVYLSKNLKYPVIVVPRNTSYKPINKIVLATDLEHLYDLPIEKITNIVNIFKARLDIVHVYKNDDKLDVMTSRTSELTSYLKALNPQFHFIKNKSVYDAIANFVKNNETDLVLTFPKRHAFFHKSESKQLIFNAPFAVMTIQ